MPEGPEVHIISEYLNKMWSGKLIVSMGWDAHSKFNKTGVKGLELVKVPCRVVGVFPRGKCIIIECINSENQTIYMVSQLGMEGKWVHTKDSYSNFRIHFGDINKEQTAYEILDTWYYSDSRHFGNFNVYSDLKEICKNHGPCYLTTALVFKGLVKKEQLRPWQELITLQSFTEKINSICRNSRTGKELCEFLMEQKHFSGVGNYLRSEILYRVKLHPRKALSELNTDQIKTLYENILEQMLISLEFDGLTIRTFSNPEGHTGNCPLLVYNQTRDPIGNPVERFKDKHDRTVHWVPLVQHY